MLIGLRFKNFRSFLKEQNFSFSADSDRMHLNTNCMRTGIKCPPQLSKTSIVFGANATGKSNFVAALQTLRNLVLHSAAYTAQQFSEQYTPYRFQAAENDATDFEIDVLLDKVRYSYRISYNGHRVLYERLLVYHTGKSQRWFERHYDASIGAELWAPYSSTFHGPREMWRKATRPAALFLTTAAQLDAVQLRPLFQWFEHHLDFLMLSKSNGVARTALRLYEAGFKSRMLGLLQSLDIRVDDVRISDQERISTENGHARASMLVRQSENERLKVEFLHSRDESESVWMRSERESAGVQRLFGLLGPLLAALEQKKLLVVDDFDRNLHPLVARQLIGLINNIETSHAQLLLTSHNVALMDLSLFRRSEIWLIEADEYCASNLFRLSRESPRKNEQIDKGYLAGRYGAVPHIE